MIDISTGELWSQNSVCYSNIIPPTPRTSSNDLELFLELLSALYLSLKGSVVIIGDFNIPNYANFITDVQTTDSRSKLIANFLGITDLIQSNNVFNANSRLLDLVLSNVNCKVIRALDVLLMEDLHQISFELSTSRLQRVPK
jgi:hypothetical protein